MRTALILTLAAATVASALAEPAGERHPPIRRAENVSLTLSSMDTALRPAVPLSVGSPPQTLLALLSFSTGDTLVSTTQQPYNASAPFLPDNSTTLSEAGRNATGNTRVASISDYSVPAPGAALPGQPPLSARGHAANDTLALGGTELAGAGFVLARPWVIPPAAGVAPAELYAAWLGLGYRSHFDTVQRWTDAWPQRYFGLYLRTRRHGTAARFGTESTDVGRLALGHTDANYTDHRGEIPWIEGRNASDGLWRVPLLGVSVGTVSTDMGMFPSFPESADSPGTTQADGEGGNGTLAEKLAVVDPAAGNYLVLPRPVLDGLMGAVPGARKMRSPPLGNATLWTVPCDSGSVLTLNVDGTEHAMVFRDHVLTHENGTCFSFLTANDNVDVPVLGASFLAAVYSVWDPTGPRIAFLPLRSMAEAAESTDAGVQPDYKLEAAAVTTTGRTYAALPSPTPAPSSARRRRRSIFAAGLALGLTLVLV